MNARILCCLAWLLAGVLTLVNPTFAQDSTANDAKALLKQGLDQYKALDFPAAKATLSKVDAAALTPADKKALDDSLGKVDDAIKQQAEARDAYAKADAALKSNDLATAKENYAKAAASEYLTQAERKDASAQLAQVDQRIKANAATTAAEKPQTPVAAAPAATTPQPAAPAVAETPVATQPADSSADALDAIQANRAQKAKELLAEGKAALDDNKPDVAVSSLERAVALTPNDVEAQKLLDQARELLAKQNPSEKTVLSSLEENRKVSKQVCELEFAKAMKLSNERLADAKTAGDFDAAMVAARDAQRQLEDKKELFTPKEYSDKTNEVSSQIAFVNTQRADWDQKRAAQALIETNIRNEERIATQAQQRREEISSLNARAKTLASEQKYAQAIGVYDQVLQLDPKNAEAAYNKDELNQRYLLKQEGQTYKDRDTESQKLGIGMREAEVPWNVLVTYPQDWQEMSVRRKDTGAGASNENEADRDVKQKLKTKIPELTFDNRPFEEVIGFFRDVSHVNFNVNWTALAVGSIDKTTPINLKLTDVTVDKALRLVLDNLSTNVKLSYVIADGVVTISTKDDLAKTPVIQVYDIRDLLFVVRDFPGGQITVGGTSSGSNTAATINNTSNNTGNAINRAQIVAQITNTITATIDPQSWAPAGTAGSIQELNGTLIVTQTLDNQEKLADLIAKLRETRALQITVEARFITVSTGFLNSIGVDLDMFFNIGSSLGSSSTVDPFTQGTAYNTSGSSGWGPTYPGNNKYTPIGVVQNGPQSQIGWGNMIGVGSGIGSEITQPAMSIGGAFLDDIQVDFLIQATQASSSTRTLIAPRLTLFNGMEANIQNGNLRNYVAQMTFVPGTGGAAGSTVSGGYTPTPGTLNLLTTLDVIAVISADRRYVTMQLTPSISTLNALTTFPLGNGGFIQLPDVQTSAISTTVTVPDGGTLLLGGQRNSEEIEREGGTPGLDKIPVLNRLFTNRGKVRDEKTLIILVRPKIIIPREEEDKAFPPQN